MRSMGSVAGAIPRSNCGFASGCVLPFNTVSCDSSIACSIKGCGTAPLLWAIAGEAMPIITKNVTTAGSAALRNSGAERGQTILILVAPFGTKVSLGIGVEEGVARSVWLPFSGSQPREAAFLSQLESDYNFKFTAGSRRI